jgi:hypothetical protein
MKTFDFHLDQKVTTWMRTEFEIKANSLKEAIEIAKEKFDNGDLDDISWEEIDGLNEVLQPSDNGNQPTAEIYYMNEVGDVREVFNNSGTFNPKEANYW